MDQLNESILATIKKMLGLEHDYTPFDMDVIIHINAALMTLCQFGVGPKGGFEVTDYSQTWADFLSANKTKLGGVKTYVYLQVKMLFDPPTNSFVMDAYKKQSEEILWRLNVQAESVERMDFMRAEGLKRGANPVNVGTEVVGLDTVYSGDGSGPLVGYTGEGSGPVTGYTGDGTGTLNGNNGGGIGAEVTGNQNEHGIEVIPSIADLAGGGAG